MVMRSPFVDQHDDFVVVQTPYKDEYLIEHPVCFVNLHHFVSLVEALSFELQREFMLGECPNVANATEQCQYRRFRRAGL